MTQRPILFSLLVLSAVVSVLDVLVSARLLGPGWTLGATLLFSLLVFVWYRRDSDAIGYRRSVLLNVAIIGVGFVAVPYYVLRSRPAGQKARALLRLLGFVALMVVAAVLGIVLLELVF